jgi:hypothetical protein
MKTAKYIAVLLVSSLCCLHVSGAETKPSTNGTATPKLPNGMPVYGKVGAVDKQASTITLQGKERVRIFYITPQTRIHRDGKPARLDEVVIGQWIGGYARPDAQGRATLSTLNLAVVQKTPNAGAANAPATPRRK